jgi:FkbM family methyltransferase
MDEDWRTFRASMPLRFNLPGGVAGGIVAEVLAGEYESGVDGVNLRVLDLGANVGAFAVWAAHRWPGSTVDAYEPNPTTFALLQGTARRYPMIRCHQAAVQAGVGPEAVLFSRSGGDGQAGLVASLGTTFTPDLLAHGERIRVAVIHPRDLPAADVIKVDVEGAEADILCNADLSATSLLLLEFQNDANLARIKDRLSREFELLYQRAEPWAAILATDSYQPDLAGDHYGVAYFLRRGQTRLWRPPDPGPLTAA